MYMLCECVCVYIYIYIINIYIRLERGQVADEAQAVVEVASPLRHRRLPLGLHREPRRPQLFNSYFVDRNVPCMIVVTSRNGCNHSSK